MSSVARQLSRSSMNFLYRVQFMPSSLFVLIAYAIQNRRIWEPVARRSGYDLRNVCYWRFGSIRGLIEALERALACLHSEVQTTQPSDAPTETPSALTDYDAFREWGSLWKSGLANSTIPLDDLETTPIDYLGETVGHSAFSGRSTRDLGMDALNLWDLINELSIFGAGNHSFSSAWPTQTETQVLEQFLAVPEASLVSRLGFDTRTAWP
ncbi:hypothetical protein BDV28DRAFT_149070 [Aspergillus coremiiformis]|uniref:Transcription factor domain-containing protein n=1 Tax=Aspergillus coremiiformis TaxID=138285 RepID=A0A5N6Z5J2_9EURO|nr:hypothetical protein BDV28DRAFT_149070 [Aspergillus coremiiformis]